MSTFIIVPQYVDVNINKKNEKWIDERGKDRLQKSANGSSSFPCLSITSQLIHLFIAQWLP
jgi:hypothetical protein